METYFPDRSSGSLVAENREGPGKALILQEKEAFGAATPAKEMAAGHGISPLGGSAISAPIMGGATGNSLATQLEELGGGTPKSIPTPKGATQFRFPNGIVLRFDIQPGQYLTGQGPHINLENAPGSSNPNIYIDLKP